MLTGELIKVLMAAVDSKLATTDHLTIEDLEMTQRLFQARVALENLARTS
jgi:hypothetical protein